MTERQPNLQAEPSHVDIPSTWGVPGMRVEVPFLREVLERQGYTLVRSKDVPSPRRFQGVLPDSDEWALCRLIELRQQGEAAKVRICWRDQGRHRLYWMQIRRADGTLESPPRLSEQAVDESMELQELPAAPAVAVEPPSHLDELAPGSLRTYREKLEWVGDRAVGDASLVQLVACAMGGDREAEAKVLSVWSAWRAEPGALK